ncbi:MAG TPA: amidohydrolase family protein, partial [Gemmatimonadales bacterium]|nr:amidohydrolase family protein [Gemmatimonadales bacterium]
RCVRELGFPGAQIGTHANHSNLDDPALFPVYEAAESLNAALFVHPWDMVGRERMPRYWLPWLVGMPAETCLAICSVIFGGVLERFPRLRLCFAHGGGSFPGTFGRIAHGFLARPDLVAVNTQTPPHQVLGRFYLDSLVHDGDMLRHLLRLVGVNRVALGSDYPFPLGESPPGRIIDAMVDLSPDDRGRLLSGTALEFLDRSPECYQ